MQIKDAPKREAALTEALRVVGEHWKSEEITKLLSGKSGQSGGFVTPGSEADFLAVETDPIDGWESAPAVDKEMPVGLTNIANTCYLNSLLQVSEHDSRA